MAGLPVILITAFVILGEAKDLVSTEELEVLRFAQHDGETEAAGQSLSIQTTQAT